MHSILNNSEKSAFIFPTPRNTGEFFKIRLYAQMTLIACLAFFDWTGNGSANAAESNSRVVAGFLETIDIDTGERTVIYSDTSILSSPNWSPDGKTLYFSNKGHIYSIPAGGGEPSVIISGHTILNHALSPGGTHLALSRRTKAAEESTNVYIASTRGGDPIRITSRGPSYLYSWSPDGMELVYSALRNGQYDIYAIQVKEGPEKQLTNNSHHDDGPDYSPCGKYIWFHSDRSGTTQVWRIERDGNNPLQMTSDSNLNRFPHPSPDGKFVVMLSFPDGTVNVNEKMPVLLRLMPAEGGAPFILAEFTGGHYSLKAPSWSPDSRRIAFISYGLAD